MVIGDQEESQQQLQITKVRPVECLGRPPESCRGVRILVIDDEMNLAVSRKVDLVEGQIVGDEEKGNMIQRYLCLETLSTIKES